MKDFTLGMISILLTVLTYEGVTALIGFNYHLFSDEFNLSSLLVDIGLFVAIFMPIYFVVKKVIFRKAN
ncbi:hypothetical protein CWR45_14015 [Oceanobacillus chungangensis]|uniref:Uncharacterized protein n=1 Tax=Oceanobacillus chungangensis TaxID=1229152 RepID=A0A3D8PNB9_9BACI|nr:hypothetical protein CWR45_14015 [Oceanobacillus chungangensis]